MRLTRALVVLGTASFVSVLSIEGCGSTKGTGGFTSDSGAPGTHVLPDGAVVTDYDSGPITSLTDDGGNSTVEDGGHYADATPNEEGGQCVASGDAGPPPYLQKCAPSTTNECAGATDTFDTSIGVPSSMLNGTNGNGFDDDCDGLVDEGCTCNGAGTTKDCYLVPPSQIDQATGAPVGWCATNSKGSLDCTGTEFSQWSGNCRGAQPPYAHDVCAPGDFNCDGLPENSDVENCTCQIATVTCPTTPIVEAPYPTPTAIAPISGTGWLAGATADGGGPLAQTMNWKWTVVGGDCDNILPHPTFAVYSGTNATATGAQIGTRTPVAIGTVTLADGGTGPTEYVSSPNAPLVSYQAPTGNGAAGATIYPAFGLSGDYIVQGEFDLEGTHYVCTQQVQVRAPGIRAELCWDTVGGDPGLSPAAGSTTTTGANDIDIHFARLQGVSCSAHGWDTICSAGNTYEDCWYDDSSGCRDFSSEPPGWGYADSPASSCIGWGSERSAVNAGAGYDQGCTNPRLDRDNIICDPTVTSPLVTEGDLTSEGGFCGPENINLDNPNNGDQFVVGVNHYANHGGTSNAHVHMDIYCNGARVLAAGYDPLTTGSASTGPLLTTPGAEATGDIWEVATVKWDTASAQGCDVATVPSTAPVDATRDGTNNTSVCVDSHATGAPVPYKNHRFIESSGAIPTTAGGFCKH